jgi:hypothetical protein
MGSCALSYFAATGGENALETVFLLEIDLSLKSLTIYSFYFPQGITAEFSTV